MFYYIYIYDLLLLVVDLLGFSSSNTFMPLGIGILAKVLSSNNRRYSLTLMAVF